jgi:uncharacterized protein (TIGR02646 family)
MLDLHTHITYLPSHQTYLATLSPYTAAVWDIKTVKMTEIKRKMKEDLWLLQNGLCAYCMKELDPRIPSDGGLALDGDREHIAPKSLHPEYIFESKNLVLACIVCNRTLKNDTDTIHTKNLNYDNCRFNIVHPYLDTISQHIEFTDGVITKIFTPEGSETVEMFKLDEPWLTRQRIKALLCEEHSEEINAILNFQGY